LVQTILIIEDDEVARAGLSSILRAHDYNVVAAANGLEAMDRLQSGLHPDLILLDMILPTYDGWKFFGRRRQEHLFEGIPVVIMTGLIIASVEWARSLGAVDLLRKPVEVDSLLETVRHYAQPEVVA
jgi:CheY-like chemotaxis protein